MSISNGSPLGAHGHMGMWSAARAEQTWHTSSPTWSTESTAASPGGSWGSTLGLSLRAKPLQGRDTAPSAQFAIRTGKCLVAVPCCHPPWQGPLCGHLPAAPTPCLSPHELQVLGGSEVLLDGVVHTLDEHARQVGALQQVGHGGAVPKGVDSPARPGRHTWRHRDLSAPQWAQQHRL